MPPASSEIGLPEVWRDLPVPDVLMSGHHEQIERWRREQRLALTQGQRPDLVQHARAAGHLNPLDEKFLEKLGGNP